MTDHPEALRERERIVKLLRRNEVACRMQAQKFPLGSAGSVRESYAAEVLRRAIDAIQEAPDNG